MVPVTAAYVTCACGGRAPVDLHSLATCEVCGHTWEAPRRRYYIIQTGPATTDYELIQSDSPTGQWVVGFTCTEEEAPQRLAEHIQFHQGFWDEKLPMRDLPMTVRISGWHYVIRPDKNYAPNAGYGGRRFDITFHDGREVTTHNLWTQGPIPSDYLERLPDNASWSHTEGPPERRGRWE